jgi:hypothetical protein
MQCTRALGGRVVRPLRMCAPGRIRTCAPASGEPLAYMRLLPLINIDCFQFWCVPDVYP